MNEHIFGLAVWGTLVAQNVIWFPLYAWKRYEDSIKHPRVTFVSSVLYNIIVIFEVYKFIEAVINDAPYLR